MRKLYIGSTALFWIVIAGLWLGGLFGPKTLAQDAASAKKLYTLQQVAAHNKPSDCWMAIHGKVYDLTAYLPEHPSRPEVIESWCGKEASNAYDTKTKGRRHSSEADRLLQNYYIGDVKAGAP